MRSTTQAVLLAAWIGFSNATSAPTTVQPTNSPVPVSPIPTGSPTTGSPTFNDTFPTGWSRQPLRDGQGYTYYKTFCEHKTWADAQAHCVSIGAHLVNIHSKEENDAVRTMVGHADSFWIGLRIVDGIRSRWRWVVQNAGHQGNTLPDYTQWNNYRGWGHEPDNNRYVGSSGNCVVMGWCNDHDGSWVDVNCAETAPFVCERELGNTVVPAGTYSDGSQECTIPGTPDLGQWQGCHMLDLGAFIAIIVCCFLVFVALIVLIIYCMFCKPAAEGDGDAADADAEKEQEEADVAGEQTNEPTKEGE